MSIDDPMRTLDVNRPLEGQNDYQCLADNEKKNAKRVHEAVRSSIAFSEESKTLPGHTAAHVFYMAPHGTEKQVDPITGEFNCACRKDPGDLAQYTNKMRERLLSHEGCFLTIFVKSTKARDALLEAASETFKGAFAVCTSRYVFIYVDANHSATCVQVLSENDQYRVSPRVELVL
jgi:hypothetical protein